MYRSLSGSQHPDVCPKIIKQPVHPFIWSEHPNIQIFTWAHTCWSGLTELLFWCLCAHIVLLVRFSICSAHPYDCLQVVCWLNHTLALSQAGGAYAFGDNSLCQLGRAGSMGVQTPHTTSQDGIVHDEDHEPIHFTKVKGPKAPPL